MSDHNESQAFKLGLENQRSVEEVRRNFEDFYREEVRFQSEMKNQISLISEKQDSLRERFEVGTAGTLRELKSSFDAFRIEWGEKKKEDQVRDKAIERNETYTAKVDSNVDWLIRSLIVGVAGSLMVAGILWAFQKFAGG